MASSKVMGRKPVAPPAYYDAWFDIAVSTFLEGVQARYAV